MYGILNDLQDAHIVGATAYAVDWLSLTEGGSALTPDSGNWYYIVTAGDYQGESYRWSGSAYVLVSSDLILGETSNTAYRGDRGKTAYDHSQVVTGNPHAVTFAELGSKPTTIAGFAITDAYTKAQVNALLESIKLIQGVTEEPLGAYTNEDTIVFASIQDYNGILIHCTYVNGAEQDNATISLKVSALNSDDIFKIHFVNTNIDVTFDSWVISCSPYVVVNVYGLIYQDILAENVLVTHTGTNYIDLGTTVKAVEILLDTQIKANADAID